MYLFGITLCLPGGQNGDKVYTKKMLTIELPVKGMQQTINAIIQLFHYSFYTANYCANEEVMETWSCFFYSSKKIRQRGVLN